MLKILNAYSRKSGCLPTKVTLLYPTILCVSIDNDLKILLYKRNLRSSEFSRLSNVSTVNRREARLFWNFWNTPLKLLKNISRVLINIKNISWCNQLVFGPLFNQNGMWFSNIRGRTDIIENKWKKKIQI